MKYLYMILTLVSLSLPFTDIQAAINPADTTGSPSGGLTQPLSTGTATGADTSSVSSGYVGAQYSNFSSELGFVTSLLESNYILALSLLIGVIGFWQFFVSANGFGIIMIIMAIGLTAFPGIYKGFYAGTRSFVHQASGATETQGWQ